MSKKDLIKIIEKIFRENFQLAIRLRELIYKLTQDIKLRYGNDLVIKIMNFCGTHEWATVHYGIRSLIPNEIDLIAGPGCPVCITPSYYIELCIKFAIEGIRIYTYGDTYKVPVVNSIKGIKSLAEAKAYGGDVQLVYSFLEAVKDAKQYGKDCVFLGIGFETIAPIYAELIINGKVPENLKLLSVVRLTPSAAKYTIEVNLSEGKSPIMGVIAPGHVSTITGGCTWEILSNELKIPTVISGFEPVDLLISIAEILRQIKYGIARTVIQYKRAVTWEGNKYAKQIMYKVFEVCDAAWRGIGFIPKSGLKLKSKFNKHDALEYFNIPDLTPSTWKYDLLHGCRCGEIMLGKAKPVDCPMYLKVCTPEKPWGPCMVSSEGTCSIWAKYGKIGIANEIAKELGLI